MTTAEEKLFSSAVVIVPHLNATPSIDYFPVKTRLAKLSQPLDAESLAMAVAPAAEVVLPAADLLARQVLRDGELILLILKPSRWYMAASCLWFVGGSLSLAWALLLSGTRQPNLRYCIDACLFAIACRLMWAVLNWMGRVYVLTNQRILRFAGVIHVDLVEFPLKRVTRTDIHRHASERLLHLGTIDIHPENEHRTAISWQMVRQPVEIREQIEAAIRKAKEGV